MARSDDDYGLGSHENLSDNLLPSSEDLPSADRSPALGNSNEEEAASRLDARSKELCSAVLDEHGRNQIPGDLLEGTIAEITPDPTGLTHIDERGRACMVDVSTKEDTRRAAMAEGFVSMNEETLTMIVEGRVPKGDVLATARIAGIMGAKQTSNLIPMCHPLNITYVGVDLEPVHKGERTDGHVGIHVLATASVTGKTGIEMEALVAVSVACLTIYDMCKAVDRGMEISEVHLLSKKGGKTGNWTRN